MRSGRLATATPLLRILLLAVVFARTIDALAGAGPVTRLDHLDGLAGDAQLFPDLGLLVALRAQLQHGAGTRIQLGQLAGEYIVGRDLLLGAATVRAVRQVCKSCGLSGISLRRRSAAACQRR